MGYGMTEPPTFDAALTFIPLFSGTLSILGASAVLFNILSDPQRRFTSPYFRIMLGLAIANVVYAVARIFSTFAAPQGTPGLYYASGNIATCSAQGFFIHLGLSQPLYTACLCIHYLLVIKYGKSDDYIAKYYEPYMHVQSIGYPLIGSIIGVSLGNFNSSPIGCWIGSFPMDCDIQDKSTCTRGKHSQIVFSVSSASLFFASFVIVASSMLVTVLHVRKRMRVMNHRFSFQQSRISRSRNLDKQYRLVTKQAVLYVATFLLAWIFEYSFRLNRFMRGKAKTPLLIPVQILNPMQGFFNFIIYVWPRFEKSKEENKEKSFWWLIHDSIITTTRSKTERRRSNDMSRRILQKRMSILRRVRLKEEAYTPSTSEKIACDEVDDQSKKHSQELVSVLDSRDENFEGDILYCDNDRILLIYQRDGLTQLYDHTTNHSFERAETTNDHV